MDVFDEFVGAVHIKSVDHERRTCKLASTSRTCVRGSRIEPKFHQTSTEIQSLSPCFQPQPVFKLHCGTQPKVDQNPTETQPIIRQKLAKIVCVSNRNSTKKPTEMDPQQATEMCLPQSSVALDCADCQFEMPAVVHDRKSLNMRAPKDDGCYCMIVSAL